MALLHSNELYKRFELEQEQEKQERSLFIGEVKKEILDSLKSKLSIEVENYMDYDCSEGETKLKVSLLLDGEMISWEEVKVG